MGADPEGLQRPGRLDHGRLRQGHASGGHAIEQRVARLGGPKIVQR